tara:strand:+ start:2479 stop:3048 length:570 start_codon:yes stop_codon:yes gene_type:complete
MALDLKLNIRTSDDCKNLIMEDVTGVYNDQDNPGGWGNFNINGNRQEFSINVNIIAYLEIEGQQYVVPISAPNFENLVDYPAEDTYRNFKVSIPSYDISTEVSNFDFIPESYDAMQEVVQDSLYEITFLIFNNQGYSQEFIFEFRSICNSQKIVDKLMGTVNLNCEDCDDTDIEQALLAKSLLESLKNI